MNIYQDLINNSLLHVDRSASGNRRNQPENILNDLWHGFERETGVRARLG